MAAKWLVIKYHLQAVSRTTIVNNDPQNVVRFLEAFIDSEQEFEPIKSSVWVQIGNLGPGKRQSLPLQR